MHEVLVNRLGGLSLPRKSVVRLTDRPDMTLDVYRGRKTTIQHLANFCKYPTKENLYKVKTQRAKARIPIKSSKRNTWKSYVSKLNYKTPIKKIWNMIRKISGKTKSRSYTHLNNSRETKATSKDEGYRKYIWGNLFEKFIITKLFRKVQKRSKTSRQK